MITASNVFIATVVLVRCAAVLRTVSKQCGVPTGAGCATADIPAHITETMIIETTVRVAVPTTFAISLDVLAILSTDSMTGF